MPKPREPYTCPRCGYNTEYKTCMRKHLFTNKKQCPTYINNLELSEEIKNHILDCRIYHIPKPANVINQTFNYNTMNNIVTQMDAIEKLSKFMKYSKLEMLDYDASISQKFQDRRKLIECDQDVEIKKNDMLEIFNEVCTACNCNSFEDFNIMYDAKYKNLKIYDGTVWLNYIVENGIKQLIISMQNNYLNDYESYLVKSRKNASNPREKQRMLELLEVYYKFLATFDVEPFIQDDEYIDTYYKVSKTKDNSFKKEIIDVLKRSSQKNINELNRKVVNLFNMDEEFKNLVIK